MILTTEIFNSLTGKAGGGFNDVKTYLEIGVREGDTFDSRVPFVSEKAVAIDCWDLIVRMIWDEVENKPSYNIIDYVTSIGKMML